MINGISNSFSATIDGLTSFELSSLVVDEIESDNVTISNNLTVSPGGTLTLPNASILDPYLSANVALKDAANTFTQTNTFPRIDFTDVAGDKIYWKPNYKTYIGGIFGAALVTETSFQQGIAWKFLEDAFETVGIIGTEFFVNNVFSTFERTVSIGYTSEQHTTDIPALRFNHQYNGGFALLRYLTDTVIVGGKGDGVFYFDVRRTTDVDENFRDGILTFRVTTAAQSSFTNREVASIENMGFIMRKGKRLWFKNEDDVLSGSILANGFEQVEYDCNQGHRFKINGTEVFNFDSVYAHFFSNLEMDIGKQISFQNAAAIVCGQIYANSSEHIIHNANVKHVFQIATVDVMKIGALGIELLGVDITGGNKLTLYDAANTASGYIKAETQSFIITTLIYDAESHSFKIDGTEIFRIDKDPSFGTITNQFKREVNIRGGYKLVLYAPDDTAFSTMQTASDGSLRLVGASVIWRALDSLGATVSVLTATGDDVTVKASNGLRITNSTGTNTSYMNQNGLDFNIYQMNNGFTNFKGVNLAGASLNVIQFTYTTLTMGLDMTCKAIIMTANNNLSQSGSGLISQTGTGTNLMKAITINADQNLTLSGTGIISQTGTGVNLMRPITFSPNGTGTKLTYYTGFLTDMNSATEIRHIVPTGSQTRFVVGATNTVLINSSGLTLGQGQIFCPGAVGNRITYNTNYVVSTAANVLRTNVPTGATHHLSVNNVDVVSIAAETTTIRNNITLPTTYTTKTSGQLGYIADGTGNTTATTFVSGTVYSLASLALGVGDWMIYGEACYQIVTAATISLEEISIAPGVALYTDAYTRTLNPNGAVGSPIRQIFKMVNVTVATTYHVTVAITYSAGSVQRTFASGAQCGIKATRIA